MAGPEVDSWRGARSPRRRSSSPEGCSSRRPPPPTFTVRLDNRPEKGVQPMAADLRHSAEGVARGRARGTWGTPSADTTAGELSAALLPSAARNRVTPSPTIQTTATTYSQIGAVPVVARSRMTLEPAGRTAALCFTTTESRVVDSSVLAFSAMRRSDGEGSGAAEVSAHLANRTGRLQRDTRQHRARRASRRWCHPDRRDDLQIPRVVLARERGGRRRRHDPLRVHARARARRLKLVVRSRRVTLLRDRASAPPWATQTYVSTAPADRRRDRDRRFTSRYRIGRDAKHR